MIVSIEGIDGSGKTTVAKAFVERLRSSFDYNAVYVRAPGQTDVGVMLRRILLDPEVDVAPRALLHLFLADMEQVFHEYNPDAYHFMVWDRYKDSTLVYQILTAEHFSKTEKQQLIDMLQHVGPVPDVTIVLDTSYEVAAARSCSGEFNGRDRFELASRDQWEARRDAYLSLQWRFPKRDIYVVDTTDIQVDEVVSVVGRLVFSGVAP